MSRLECNSFVRCCANTIPLTFDDSMTYYEALCKLTSILNEHAKAINNNADASEALKQKISELQSYVDNYFANLDIQTEINAKLDVMANDGTLERIINEELFDNLSKRVNDSVIPRKYIRIAHRGASGDAPENTVSAFKVAVQEGFDAIETDLQKTKDGVFVCLHDETVDSMTNGSGYVSAKTLAEIKALNIDAGTNYEFYHEKIPTFKEYLDVCKEGGLIPYVELKRGLSIPDADEIYNIIDEYGLTYNAVIISQDSALLEHLKLVNPNLSFLLVATLNDENITYCSNNGFAIASNVGDELSIEKAHRMGVRVNLWEVRDAGSFENFWNLNFDSITANSMSYIIDPRVIVKYAGEMPIYLNEEKYFDNFGMVLRGWNGGAGANLNDIYNSQIRQVSNAIMPVIPFNIGNSAYVPEFGKYKIALQPFDVNKKQLGARDWIKVNDYASNDAKTDSIIYRVRLDTEGRITWHDLQEIKKLVDEIKILNVNKISYEGTKIYSDGTMSYETKKTLHSDVNCESWGQVYSRVFEPNITFPYTFKATDCMNINVCNSSSHGWVGNIEYTPSKISKITFIRPTVLNAPFDVKIEISTQGTWK